MRREHVRDALDRLTAAVEALEKRIDAVESRVLFDDFDEPEPHEHKDWRARAHNREAP